MASRRLSVRPWSGKLGSIRETLKGSNMFMIKWASLDIYRALDYLNDMSCHEITLMRLQAREVKTAAATAAESEGRPKGKPPPP